MLGGIDYFRAGTGVFWLLMAVLFLTCNSALMYEGAVRYASTAKLQLILGAVAISTPWILAVLPFQAGISLRRTIFGLRRPTAGTMVVLTAYGVFIAYNVLNGSNALTTSRVEVVASKQRDFDVSLAARDQREALVREQRALPTYRPVATVAALIAAEKTSKRWKASGECLDITAKASREYCKDIRTLDSELAAGKRGEELLARIAAIDERIAQTGPASGETDPQAQALARFTGMSEADIRAAIGAFGPLALEFGALTFLAFAGRALGWSHASAMDCRPRHEATESPFNPAPLISPEAARAAPAASLDMITAQRRLAEWFFANCTRPVASGSLPEADWYEHYTNVCKRSRDVPLSLDAFRRVAARAVPVIQEVDGVTHYQQVLPLIPTDAG